ncbi:double-strand break repair protein MRE11-like [Amphibalanus amphitrite]|uniref:double-strand break repair protein MRE11-like n=1 Tax=Amphibalanus amphitrite TaxID=1232801 RepID=UPI001C9001FD|nr:double-strand break repair protein MRE11-like [Amphibalanus amphitrite]XP_043220824.1 double-strand break repair protein MRE11-like [Amphibalanus amphitrite]
MSQEFGPEDEFRILVATDNHLGYNEKHGERGDDSLITFEEILQLALEKEADFILLGGDLFHENKPSRNCVIQCSQLLKKYCFGDRPVSFEYLSDPSKDFCMKEPQVNFHDPNLNIAMPVFSIHGNHDDISGLGDTAALELLSVAGLINYFGRCTDLREVQLSPVLLQKGRTRLALYGLGNIRDERLHRIFTGGKFLMLRPKEDTESWFNLFVLHQNRTKHGPKSYIPVEFLDDFLDLVIWGHEHENRLEPEWQEIRKLHISQPGSSVATSLCDGEAKPKAVGLLHVRGKEFKMESLPLRTVRPFMFRTVRLADSEAGRDPAASDAAELAQQYVAECVERMLLEAEEQITGHPRQPRQPLLRLRVEYSEEAQLFHTVRFGQQFAGRVSNWEDMILMKRERSELDSKDVKDGPVMTQTLPREEMRVEDFVAKHFSEMEEGTGLRLLNELKMGMAVNHFVVKEDSTAIAKALQHQIGAAVKNLLSRNLLDVSEDSIGEELDAIREERRQRKLDKLNATAATGDSGLGTGTTAAPSARRDSDDDEEEMLEVLETDPAPRRPAAQEVTILSSDSDGDTEMDCQTAPAPPGRRGRGAAATTGRGGRGRAGRGAGDARTPAAPRGRGGRGRGRAAANKGMVPLETMFAAASRSSRASQSQSQSQSQSASSRRPSRAASKGIVFDSDSD